MSDGKLVSYWEEELKKYAKFINPNAKGNNAK